MTTTTKKHLFQSHPWHGVTPGLKAPELVNAYIEIVPTDAVKYELDKPSGHLRVDRPQRFSSMCPTLYGFIPQTYCGVEVAELCAQRTGRQGIEGDKDPMDVCVLSEKTFAHGDSDGKLVVPRKTDERDPKVFLFLRVSARLNG